MALLLAAQPLLHNHSLDTTNPNSASACAVCVAGAGRLPSTTPSLAAPLAVLYTLTTPALPEVAAVESLARSSRAPPAA
ncbi:MAG: hypothetical protein JO093_22275 [Acidobacteria bacterium]|nr:hypothetical protein [Acidobacteriota bacterium]MBV9069332.1 hypothetical protein [Acidobacteriota bacterium]MBV9188352.1 hypothetical protein [Acidobacteriota bacterium]